VVQGDKIEVATIVSCTLSCDHRVVDGAVGAELLNAFKMLMEDPVRMLV
jgi:pyruvate dehydrogenase E2 component (dihydrolipoamide acetyltransferase)